MIYSDGETAEDGYRYYTTGIAEAFDPTIIVSGGDSLIVVERCMYEKPEKYIAGPDSDGSGVFFGGPERFKDYILQDWDSYGIEWREFRPGVWEDGIESIEAWSTLTETVKGEAVTYGADRLRYPFYSFIDAELCFNNAMLFWAEGEAGPGIGGTIRVAFNRPSDHMMVLNGAVDFARLNLYKDNNRLKRMLVRADDGSFAFEHVFDDVVAFHKIPFPAQARGRRLQAQILHQLHVLEVLARDLRDGDVEDIEVLALDEVEQQIQRPLERLQEHLQGIRRDVEILGQLGVGCPLHHRKGHLLLLRLTDTSRYVGHALLRARRRVSDRRDPWRPAPLV